MTSAQPFDAGAPAEPSDEEARRRIREDLGATLIVEAAAGTGQVLTSSLIIPGKP